MSSWRRALLCLFMIGALGAPAQAAPGEIRTFVWRVRAPGARQADHLLGTMHVPLKLGQKLPAAVEKLVRGASRFVMEVDLETADQALVRRYAAIERGQDLRALLAPAEWKKLVELTAPMGLAEAELRGLDPWFVALSFLPTPAESGALMDSRLRELAEQARVPVAFLEGAEDQFRALDAVAMREDLAQLSEILDDPSKPAAELARLERSYLAGDLAAVESYLFDPERVRAYPDFYEKLFYRRNANWLPTLERILKRERAFVAVGLGHLLGERGLLRLLARRGWRVEREPAL